MGSAWANLGRGRRAKLVAEVLKNMTEKGQDGVLLDDTPELTDIDLLTVGEFYKS